MEVDNKTEEKTRVESVYVNNVGDSINKPCFMIYDMQLAIVKFADVWSLSWWSLFWWLRSQHAGGR
jgi:hypothetical protein